LKKTYLLYTVFAGREFVRIYDEKPDKYELVIALDTGDLQRLGKRVEIFNDADMTVNIDHHPTNTYFAQLNLVNTNSAAVGEMIYRLLKKMEINLDRDMATCLYVAIATDTGGFRYGNTTTVTHQITADLINNGVDVSYISKLYLKPYPCPR